MSFGEERNLAQIHARRSSDRRLSVVLMVIGCLLLGCLLRFIPLEHATIDATDHVIPWYIFARDHGIDGLGNAFTDYTPFYSYLLLIAAQMDRLGQPLTLIKAISFVFEYGCALAVAFMVWRANKAPSRACVAFCCVWLAPTVIFNGAAWGQADSIWTFFILVSIATFMQHRNGMLPFAVAVAVKAQGVFLGPFVLGMMLRNRIHWAWLAAVPVVYVVVALPVLLAGRSTASVFGVYIAQADMFHRLSMNAANIWVFSGDVPYNVGVVIGAVLAALAGLGLSALLARSKREGPEFLLLVACASLMIMPYLLPKMHDRYFYSFEIASIGLACLNARYLPFAVIAQTSGVLSYLGFERDIVLGIFPAAACNTLLAIYLVLDLSHDESGSRFPTLAWLGYAASIAALFAYLLMSDPRSSISATYLLLASLVIGTSLLVIKGSRSASVLERPKQSLPVN